MRVLGIDCGTDRTGFGIIDSDGREHRLVIYGVIRTSARDELPARLLSISARLSEVMEERRPDTVAIEDVFTGVNIRSTIKLAHVRGVAMLAAAARQLPVGEYSPLSVKSSVVGYGRAEKQQVQMMVRSILKLDAEVESADAADALAVAICHAVHCARPVGVR